MPLPLKRGSRQVARYLRNRIHIFIIQIMIMRRGDFICPWDFSNDDRITMRECLLATIVNT